jgi:hypothetical protein
MILRAKPAVAWLLAGSPKPDRSNVMAQTKMDTLVLQVGGWAWGYNPTPGKNIYVQKTSEMRRMIMEASYEGGQGSEGAVAPYMDGKMYQSASSLLPVGRNNW